VLREPDETTVCACFISIYGELVIEKLLQDLRYSFRVMVKSPVLTGAAIIALALGIGANTAIFSVVNAVLLRPLPYENPAKIIRVWGTQPQKGAFDKYFAAPDYTDLRDQNQVFEHLAAFRSWPFTLTGMAEPITVWGQRVTASFFPVLGVYPALGRAFTEDEELAAKNTVVILSHKFWQSRFNGERNILGQTITINDVSRTVVGVMPPGFEFPQGDASVLYIPYTFSAWEANRGRESMSAIGRLKPGVSLSQAQANLESIAAQIEQQYPDTNKGKSVRTLSLHDDIAGKIRPALIILLGAVGIVLLIACANVANLMLARALARQKEIALRIALGATRARLIRQLLTESVVLSLTGGVIGFLLSYWGLNLIIGLSTDDLPRVKETSIDGNVLGFTLIVSLLMGVLFGLVPALQASRPDLNDTLKDGGTSGTSVHKQRARSLLVVLEIAVALMLLVGAGLMIRSFITLQNTNPGFNVENVLTTSTF
jgi:putative ABC transport system permease protein